MKKRYRNTAFLVELLINILVFSISCAVLVGLFGKAAEMTRDTKEESTAGTEVQRLAEIIKAGGADAIEGTWEDGQLVCRYDENWNATTAADAAYVVTLQKTETQQAAGVLHALEGEAHSAAGRQLYAYATAYYVPAAAPAKAGEADA